MTPPGEPSGFSEWVSKTDYVSRRRPAARTQVKRGTCAISRHYKRQSHYLLKSWRRSNSCRKEYEKNQAASTLREHRSAIRTPATSNRVRHREWRSCDSDAARSWIRLQRISRYQPDVESLHRRDHQHARRTPPIRRPAHRQRTRHGWPGPVGKRHLLGRVPWHDQRLAGILKWGRELSVSRRRLRIFYPTPQQNVRKRHRETARFA